METIEEQPNRYTSVAKVRKWLDEQNPRKGLHIAQYRALGTSGQSSSDARVTRKDTRTVRYTSEASIRSSCSQALGARRRQAVEGYRPEINFADKRCLPAVHPNLGWPPCSEISGPTKRLSRGFLAPPCTPVSTRTPTCLPRTKSSRDGTARDGTPHDPRLFTLYSSMSGSLHPGCHVGNNFPYMRAFGSVDNLLKNNPRFRRFQMRPDATYPPVSLPMVKGTKCEKHWREQGGGLSSERSFKSRVVLPFARARSMPGRPSKKKKGLPVVQDLALDAVNDLARNHGYAGNASEFKIHLL